MKIGIIGLPNVGKSTLFQTLTKKQVEISNYPFCTIDPNVGVVKVPDQRLNKLAKLNPPARVLPAQIEFVDIAGLVRNAHKGEGLGNQFLAYIRGVDALVHVVRGFYDSQIPHPEKEINPEKDREIVNAELILADLATIKTRREKTTPQAKSGDQEKIEELAILEKAENFLEKGIMVKNISWEDKEKEFVASLFLLTNKPIIYLLNSDENKKENHFVLPQPNLSLPLKLELEIAELPFKEQKKYRQELGLSTATIDTLITLSFQLLNLITFYTIKGGKETRAWPIPWGTLALEAAGRIHTDFKKGFIKAEVIPWQKLVEAGSWQKAHNLGWIEIRGKDYKVLDGDVIEFKFKK